MGADVDTGGGARRPRGRPRTARLRVALGRRVEVIGDLLLPAEPTDSSRAACRDIARRLEEWQGPGIVILCGRLVAPGCPDDPAGVVGRHADLTDALATFAARADSQVIVVMAPSERDPALVRGPGAARRDGARRRSTSPARPAPARARCSCAPARCGPTPTRRWTPSPPTTGPGWPAWSAWTTRAWRAASSPRACCTGGCAATSGRRRSRWPPSRCCCGSSSWSTASAGCSARPASRPRSSGPTTPPGPPASSSPWSSPSRCSPSSPSWSPSPRAASGGRSAARASRPRGPAAPSGARPIAHAQLEIDGEDALDATRAAVEAGASGVIVGGALVPELTHLDAGFFACPGATSEVVHEHRGRLGLPPTFLHHRQESTLEIETGAELHVRLLLAEADLPAGHHGRAAGDRRRRGQGPLQGGRGPRRAGRRLAERGVVAAGARGGGGPHPGASHPPHRRGLPVRRRRHRPALLRHDAAARAPAPDRAVPARRRRPGRRGADRHRRHRHDHALPRHPQGPAPLVAGRRGAARRVARPAPRPRRRRRHARRLRRRPHAARSSSASASGPRPSRPPSSPPSSSSPSAAWWRRSAASSRWRWPAVCTTTRSPAGPTCCSARPNGSSACSGSPSRPPSTATPPSACWPSASASSSWRCTC